MYSPFLNRLTVAALALALAAGCTSNGNNQYAPVPGSGNSAVMQPDAAGATTRLVPSTLVINDVVKAVEKVDVRGLALGKPIRIATNTCGDNLTATVSGTTVAVEVNKLFEVNPQGCTISVDAGGMKLPLAVRVPSISFAALKLPLGSKLSGNVLKLPNSLLASLLDPTLRIAEVNYNGAFSYVSESCYGESILLVQLLEPDIGALNKLKLRPVTNAINGLYQGAECGVIVSDAAGRSVTLIVQIPSQLP